ncbi:MAG: hypothetical protein KDK78_04775, partial [Chlamydiia bacterium]|nr:hypothetical protein [Chlamydiia bacterium]
CLLTVLCCATSSSGAPIPRGAGIGGEVIPKMVVSNRILANVAGKPITVFDVMKQMDMHFHQRFPEYASSPMLRYQFFQANWRQTLLDLVDKELIMADAREVGLPVKKGDVRDELERTFGPHLMVALSQIGMSYEDAYRMVEEEISIRRMVFMRVHYKAQQQITPGVVKDEYERYVCNFDSNPVWTYRVLSIRGRNAEEQALVANRAETLQKEGIADLTELKKRLETEGLPEGVSISVSSDFEHRAEDLSAAYLASLRTLNSGEMTSPIAQNSRDQQRIYRIFHLLACDESHPEDFGDRSRDIENAMLQDAVVEGRVKYIQSLRERFRVQDDIAALVPEDFQPFQLV